ncbi:MAG: hypothetical protein ABI596_12385 [Pyrinomonadaceae bacterium]
MRLIYIARKITLLAAVVCGVMGCGLIQGLGEPKVLKSGNGRFQLTIPSGWREDSSLHSTASIRASNRLQEMYVIVISEDKEKFADDVTLEQFTTVTRDSMLKKVGSSEASPPVGVTVAETYPGLQYGVQGEVDNMQIAYLVTNVETPKDFHQIIAWTLRSRISQNETKLQALVNTFRANY